MPRQQQPDLIRKEYWRAILPHTRKAQQIFAQIRPEIIRQLEDLRRRQGKQDIADDIAIRLIQRAAARSADAFSPKDVADIAERFGRRTAAFQKQQLDRQLTAAMGVSYSALERPVRDRVPAFVDENVALIRTVDERYWQRIEDATREAFETGMEPDTLAERLQEIDGISDRDALRIARDQIGKLSAQVNEDRQRSVGVSGYFWRGAMDNRERDEHRDLEGQRFEWGDPPPAGPDGEPANPGEAIQCRCYAEPDLSDILDAAE